MKAKKIPPAQTTEQVLRVVLHAPPERSGSLSAKGAVVAIVAILVSGAVAASALYGVATHDYSVLKGLGDSVREALSLLVTKVLK